MEKELKDKVYINKSSLVLWGKPIVKDVNIIRDDGVAVAIESEIGVKKIWKANKYEIFAVKYFVPVLLIFFLNTYSFHHASLTGFGLMGMLYVIGFLISKKFGLQTLAIYVISVVSIIVLFLTANIVGLSNTGDLYYSNYLYRISFSFTINYMIQTFIFLYILHHIFASIVNKEYENYYKVEDNLFRYLKFDGYGRINLSKKFWIFGILVFTISMLSFAIGAAEFAKRYVTNKQIIKKFESFKSEQEMLDFLKKVRTK